jgi:hypothetical protein
MRIIILLLCCMPLNGFGQVTPLHSKHIALDLPEERCNELEKKGFMYAQNFLFQSAYDTLRYLIENCPFYNRVSDNFPLITSSVYRLVVDSQETSSSYREWLKSVLYLNPTVVYYCDDAIEIAKSYLLEYENGVVYGDEAVTVCRFLLDSADCTYMEDEIHSVERDLARFRQYEHWKDTVTDSLKTPYSPGYTTLEALDLTILRGFKNAVTPDIHTPLNKRPITDVRAIPNPLKDEVELWYKLTEGALVKIEVYDALGKQMYSLAQGYKPEGENRLHLDTRSWSSGTFYACFTTLGGEVKTIKLLKE